MQAECTPIGNEIVQPTPTYHAQTSPSQADDPSHVGTNQEKSMPDSNVIPQASSESALARYGSWTIAAAGLGIILLFVTSVGIASMGPNDRPLPIEFLMSGVGILLIGLNEAIPPEYARISLGIRVALYLCGAYLITVLGLNIGERVIETIP